LIPRLKKANEQDHGTTRLQDHFTEKQKIRKQPREVGGHFTGQGKWKKEITNSKAEGLPGEVRLHGPRTTGPLHKKAERSKSGLIGLA
jgi:hypothetical protein